MGEVQRSQLSLGAVCEGDLEIEAFERVVMCQLWCFFLHRVHVSYYALKSTNDVAERGWRGSGGGFWEGTVGGGGRRGEGFLDVLIELTRKGGQRWKAAELRCGAVGKG